MLRGSRNRWWCVEIGLIRPVCEPSPEGSYGINLKLSGQAGGGEPVPAQTIREDLRRFYFDTALSSSSALPSLLAFAHPGRVLYGTDWPLCPSSAVTGFTARLDTFLSDTDWTLVNRANAEKLFPRLALKPARRATLLVS